MRPWMAAALAATGCLWLCTPAHAVVPSTGQNIANGTQVDSPCKLTNHAGNDEEKRWLVMTVDPARQKASEGGGDQLAEQTLQRPEAFTPSATTLHDEALEGYGFPQTGDATTTCQVLDSGQLDSIASDQELALYRPGPYVLEQYDDTVTWKIVPDTDNSSPQPCGSNDPYYTDPESDLDHPAQDPPEHSHWAITAFCNTSKIYLFNVLGGTGQCPSQASPSTQDGSQFPGVPYFSQYDAGARVNLPLGASRKGGNACGPSSLLMAMRWAIDFTAGRQGWSQQEVIDAEMGLPPLTSVFDATMNKTRAQVASNGSNFFVGNPKALAYLKSLGWSGAKVVSLGTSLDDIATFNQQKITTALAGGPIVISTAFGTRKWGISGGGHMIMVLGFDREHPNEVDVYDPAGNYFSTPNGGYHDTAGGHYGPGSCGYAVPYPMSWLVAFTTGRWFLQLGNAPATDPPVISLYDADPGAATAPESFWLQDAQGRRTGWIDGQAVNEIPDSFAGQDENFYTDPAAGDPDIEPNLDPLPAAPRTLIVPSPQPGTTLHVKSGPGGSYALGSDAWSGGSIDGHDDLSGSSSPGADTAVDAPTLTQSIGSGSGPSGGGGGPGSSPGGGTPGQPGGPGATTAPGGTTTTSPSGGRKVVTGIAGPRSLRVSADARGVFRLRGVVVSCGPGPCAVSAVATAPPASVRGGKRRRPRPVVVGSTRLRLRSDARGGITIRLSAVARRALARHRTLALTVTVTVSDAARARHARAFAVRVQAPPRPRRHRR